LACMEGHGPCAEQEAPVGFMVGEAPFGEGGAFRVFSL